MIGEVTTFCFLTYLCNLRNLWIILVDYPNLRLCHTNYFLPFVICVRVAGGAWHK